MGGGGRGERRGLKTAEILLAESCRKQVSFESGLGGWGWGGEVGGEGGKGGG